MKSLKSADITSDNLNRSIEPLGMRAASWFRRTTPASCTAVSAFKTHTIHNKHLGLCVRNFRIANALKSIASNLLGIRRFSSRFAVADGLVG